ncbi:hypothetical protein [Kluyvera georgiana]|uniref:hypothetical protein n=1 Tax=Kluyvera georgiana TaxID=73098 RepID=UPI0013DBD545|nr:hypothetical protein [Kluyvera georgiana]
MRDRASAESSSCDVERVAKRALLYSGAGKKFALAHSSSQLSKSAGFGVKVAFCFPSGL